MNARIFRSSLKNSGILLLLLLVAIPADAQFGRRRRPDPGPLPKNIKGVVQDLRGTALPGARVFVRDMKTNVIRTLTTDAQGLYSIFALSPKVDYEVYAEYRGQTSEKKLVSAFLNRQDNVLNFQIDVVVIENSRPVIDDADPEFETFDRVRLHASFQIPTGVPAPIPAVLLLHGYGEDRLAWDGFKDQLLNRGWAVMTLDLRGHGESKTKNQQPIQASPEWRASSHEFPVDLDPALDWLKAQPRIDNRKIAVIGFDIGANLALIASGRFPEVRTVVAVQPNLTESLGMAGSAQDFHPKSALVVARDETEGNRIRGYVTAPARVLALAGAAGTAKTFGEKALTDAIFQWLKETY